MEIEREPLPPPARGSLARRVRFEIEGPGGQRIVGEGPLVSDADLERIAAKLRGERS